MCHLIVPLLLIAMAQNGLSFEQYAKSIEAEWHENTQRSSGIFPNGGSGDVVAMAPRLKRDFAEVEAKNASNSSCPLEYFMCQVNCRTTKYKHCLPQ
jgi:hypothetical protein